jgi:hypothetical protein
MKKGRSFERPDDHPSPRLSDAADDIDGLDRIGRAVRRELRRLAQHAPAHVAAELRRLADREVAE